MFPTASICAGGGTGNRVGRERKGNGGREKNRTGSIEQGPQRSCCEPSHLAQWVKLPLRLPASHIGVSAQVWPSLLPGQHLMTSKRQWIMVQVCQPPAPNQNPRLEFLAPGFSLDQLWPQQPFGGVNQQMRDWHLHISLSHCLS